MPSAEVRSRTEVDLWRSRWPWTLSNRRLVRHRSCLTPRRDPRAASPLRGSHDHFGVRRRSWRPNRCQARLTVTSLLPNFSAASWTRSSIRIVLCAARAASSCDPIQRAIARSSSLCASLSMVGDLPCPPPSRPNATPSGPPSVWYRSQAALRARIQIQGTGKLGPVFS